MRGHSSYANKYACQIQEVAVSGGKFLMSKPSIATISHATVVCSGPHSVVSTRCYRLRVPVSGRQLVAWLMQTASRPSTIASTRAYIIIVIAGPYGG